MVVLVNQLDPLFCRVLANKWRLSELIVSRLQAPTSLVFTSGKSVPDPLTLLTLCLLC